MQRQVGFRLRVMMIDVGFDRVEDSNSLTYFQQLITTYYLPTLDQKTIIASSPEPHILTHLTHLNQHGS